MASIRPSHKKENFYNNKIDGAISIKLKHCHYNKANSITAQDNGNDISVWLMDIYMPTTEECPGHNQIIIFIKYNGSSLSFF